MALSYNDFEKQKTSKSKLSYDAFSSSKTKETLTQKVGRVASPIVDTLAKVYARGATNVAQTVQVASKLPEILKTGKTTFTPIQYSDINKKVPILSQKIAETVKPFELRTESFGKDIKDIAGGAAEIVSMANFATAPLKGLALKTLAKEGAISGFMGVGGQQIQDNRFDAKELALGTGGGAVAGPLLGLLGRGINKAFGGAKKNEILEEAFKVPALTKEERYAEYLKTTGYEPYKNPNKLPEIKMGAKPKPSTPVIEYGKSTPSVITPDTKVSPKTQIPTSNMINSPEDVERVLGGIIRDGKKAPELAEQFAKIPTEQVVPQPISQEIFSKADDVVEQMPDSNIMTPFERQKNVEQIASIMSRPQDEIFNVVKGNVDVPDNIPRDAYLSVAKNIVDETTDPKLKAKLSIELLPYRKEISSKSGQKLQANVIAKKDNIVDILGEIEDAKFKKLNKDAQLRYSKELEDAIQAVQKEFESIRNLPNTREQVVAALSKLIC